MTQTLSHLENLVYTESFSESEEIIVRINRLAKTTLCWYEYQIYRRLLLTKPCDATYTQLIYQLIPEIVKEDDEIKKLVDGLIGENFETEEECLFTQELRDEVYRDLLHAGATYCSCLEEDHREGDYPYDGNPDYDSE